MEPQRETLFLRSITGQFLFALEKGIKQHEASHSTSFIGDML